MVTPAEIIRKAFRYCGRKDQSADPLCACGHDELTHGGEPGWGPTWCRNDDCDCHKWVDSPEGSEQ